MLRTHAPSRSASGAISQASTLLFTCLLLLVLPRYIHALNLHTLAPQHMLNARHGMKHEYQKQVEALEMQWRKAQLANDIPAISRLLADDYIGITANGMVQTRDEALALYKSRTLVFHKLDLAEVKVHIHGNTAVVTSKAEVEATNGGADISGLYRYTRVYVRKLGTWKIVNFEVTRVYDPSMRASIPENH
ncbi:MAG: nuclear transport factor 2 family protein [Acidobacteriaceae bacterium]